MDMVRSLTSGQIFPSLSKSLSDSSSQTQDQIKRMLLCGLQGEKSPEIRRKISDVVSELGLALLDDGSWNDLFPFLFNLSDSPDEGLRISAMEVFGYVPLIIALDGDRGWAGTYRISTFQVYHHSCA